MNFLHEALAFIFTAQNWTGPAGLGIRIVEHLQYTGIAVVFSALIAVPVTFGLLAGAGTGIGKMITDGIKDLAPTAAMLFFAISVASGFAR